MALRQEWMQTAGIHVKKQALGHLVEEIHRPYMAHSPNYYPTKKTANTENPCIMWGVTKPYLKQDLLNHLGESCIYIYIYSELSASANSIIDIVHA